MKTRQKTDWVNVLTPLFKQYRGRKHPLQYKNRYQLVVMVILAAQASDKQINGIAPAFFERFPSMKDLADVRPEDLFPYLSTVRNFANKAKWLVGIAETIGDSRKIPSTMETLTQLPGIGRKSANVIISEAGGAMEGVIVDLHVMRVAPRIGIADGLNPEKIERQLMERIPQKYWRELGMSLTFLGREICRPTNPLCPECVMNHACKYYKSQQKKKK